MLSIQLFIYRKLTKFDVHEDELLYFSFQWLSIQNGQTELGCTYTTSSEADLIPRLKL